MISMLRTCSPKPRTLGLGSAPFSSTTVCKPCSRSSAASIMPVGPPPTTTTSILTVPPPFPRVPVQVQVRDSAARPGACRKPPGALYVGSGGESPDRPAFARAPTVLFPGPCPAPVPAPGAWSPGCLIASCKAKTAASASRPVSVSPSAAVLTVGNCPGIATVPERPAAAVRDSRSPPRPPGHPRPGTGRVPGRGTQQRTVGPRGKAPTATRQGLVHDPPSSLSPPTPAYAGAPPPQDRRQIVPGPSCGCGSTAGTRHQGTRDGDHPRGCGEHICGLSGCSRKPGPSP